MSEVKINGKVISGFETRPAWKTPMLCETVTDTSLRDNPPIGIKLSIGIKIPITDDILEGKLMDAMSNGIENVLKQEGLIK